MKKINFKCGLFCMLILFWESCIALITFNLIALFHPPSSDPSPHPSHPFAIYPSFLIICHLCQQKCAIIIRARMYLNAAFSFAQKFVRLCAYWKKKLIKLKHISTWQPREQERKSLGLSWIKGGGFGSILSL